MTLPAVVNIPLKPKTGHQSATRRHVVLGRGERVWLISGAEGSSTTVLLPEEY